MTKFEEMSPEEREAWWTELVRAAQLDIVLDEKSQAGFDNFIYEIRDVLLGY